MEKLFIVLLLVGCFVAEGVLQGNETVSGDRIEELVQALLENGKLIDEQVEKLELMSQLREALVESNKTDFNSTVEELHALLSAQEERARLREIGSGERSELAASLINRFLQKSYIQLDSPLLSLSLLHVKPYRVADDSHSSVIVAAATETQLELLDISGHHLNSLSLGNKIKFLAGNPHADEYFFSTSDESGNLRFHSFELQTIQRPKEGSPDNQTQGTSRISITTKELTTTALGSKITALTNIHGKGQKIALAGDEEGRTYVVYKNGTIFRTLQTATASVLRYMRAYPHAVLAASDKMGYISPTDGFLGESRCDPTLGRVTAVAPDPSNSNTYYVLLDTGDILVYEIKHALNTCRLVFRFAAMTSLSAAGLDSAGSVQMFALRGLLLLTAPGFFPQFLVYNTSGVEFLQMEPPFTISFLQRDLNSSSISSIHIETFRGQMMSALLIVAYTAENRSHIHIFDVVTPLQKSGDDWFNNLKIPFVVIAIALVLLYQFMRRRTPRESEHRRVPPGRAGYGGRAGSSAGQRFSGATGKDSAGIRSGVGLPRTVNQFMKDKASEDFNDDGLIRRR